jgi:hypothetical protein
VENTSEKKNDLNGNKAGPERKSGSYIMESSNEDNTVNVIFSMKEKVGALADALKIFKVFDSYKGNNLSESSLMRRTLISLFHHMMKILFPTDCQRKTIFKYILVFCLLLMLLLLNAIHLNAGRIV